jgi:DNA invertase Pin-like site-specific DNA recombinase
VLDEVLSSVRKWDTLAVWRLGRLGRSLRHLIEIVALLAERGIGFTSRTEQIDTTTPGVGSSSTSSGRWPSSSAI